MPGKTDLNNGESAEAPEHTTAMAKLMPNSKLIILPGAHGSFIGEVCTADKNSRMPELTAAMIEEFLDGK